VTRVSSLVVVLGFLPFLYVVGESLSSLPSDEVLVVVAAFLGEAALGLYYLFDLRHAAWVVGIGVSAMAIELLVTAIYPAAVGSLPSDVAWATLLDAPILFLIIFSQSSEGPGTHLVGLQLALADGIFLLATPSVLPGPPPPVTAGGLVSGYFVALRDQLTGIGNLAVGQPAGYVPLRAVNDPWFAGLAGLAVLVTFLTFVRPMTGREVELPTRTADVAAASSEEEVLEHLSPQFRSVLQARSLPEGAPVGRFPGASSLFAAVAVGALFLSGVFAAPAGALLLASATLLGLLVLVVAVLRWPIAQGPPPSEGAFSPQLAPTGTTKEDTGPPAD
jgi:hypothetical protein